MEEKWACGYYQKTLVKPNRESVSSFPVSLSLWSFVVLKALDFTNPEKDLKESQCVLPTRVQKLTVSENPAVDDPKYPGFTSQRLIRHRFAESSSPGERSKQSLKIINQGGDSRTFLLPITLKNVLANHLPIPWWPHRSQGPAQRGPPSASSHPKFITNKRLVSAGRQQRSCSAIAKSTGVIFTSTRNLLFWRFVTVPGII